MKIIKLNAIESTNTYLKELVRANSIYEDTVVWTTHQTEGRGQHGNSWLSELGKNLAISLYTRLRGISIEDRFALTMAASLAVCDMLETLQISNYAVKWPNDILSRNKKIGGILIENTVKRDIISAAIVGIGLNLNQKSFLGLPQASSLAKLTNRAFQPEKVLEILVNALKRRFQQLQSVDFSLLKMEYESKLFRKDEVSTFSFPDHSKKVGIIKGVTDEGLLCVAHPDDVNKKYDLKEIALLY
ncbi:biotin--[acetyl-CoA-carboxylase] ligase [Luteirhabdus pelagi]|uniref:biotin--[acetyl-CoA-carboxylase] ligase n=1 Tax=Luteirhabdus pelagi TaxID=2792783 RepID=UPI00193A0651|nr:biotin--[acetyl-CoA-carboxylase] ligase [Luteirhabdus pelagi]